MSVLANNNENPVGSFNVIDDVEECVVSGVGVGVGVDIVFCVMYSTPKMIIS